MSLLRKKTLLVLAVLFIIPGYAMAAGDCLECHRGATPAAVRQWEASAHAGAGIGCEDCHGGDHELLVSGQGRVAASTCGRCHQQAYAEHAASRHGMGLHSGWGCTRNLNNPDTEQCRFCHEQGSTRPFSMVQCARFLKQSPQMAEIGCNRCHQVEDSCGSCHTSHLTDLAIVRDPGVCAKCHMGPDHPQWEMWQSSQHGTLFKSAGGSVGPSCQRCHMPRGTHDVSGGLTKTPAMSLYPAEELKARREAMLAICGECHSGRMARADLDRADAVREQSLALVKRAEGILLDLHDRGLLDPMPGERQPHPLAGRELVTDGQMLYEDTSHIERLFFKMKKYDLAKTVKGAYHQNPAYTHWYGNAELKMDLVDIEAEARRLQRAGAAPSPAETGGDSGDIPDIESQLQLLKKRFERGALSAEEFSREKLRLLEKFSR